MAAAVHALQTHDTDNAWALLGHAAEMGPPDTDGTGYSGPADVSSTANCEYKDLMPRERYDWCKQYSIRTVALVTRTNGGKGTVDVKAPCADSQSGEAQSFNNTRARLVLDNRPLATFPGIYQPLGHMKFRWCAQNSSDLEEPFASLKEMLKWCAQNKCDVKASKRNEKLPWNGMLFYKTFPVEGRGEYAYQLAVPPACFASSFGMSTSSSKGVPSAATCPLVLSLHSAGSRWSELFLSHMNEGQCLSEMGVVVMSPTIESDDWSTWHSDWVESTYIRPLVTTTLQNHEDVLDRNRVFVVGVSMGSHGALALGFQMSDVFVGLYSFGYLPSYEPHGVTPETMRKYFSNLWPKRDAPNLKLAKVRIYMAYKEDFTQAPLMWEGLQPDDSPIDAELSCIGTTNHADTFEIGQTHDVYNDLWLGRKCEQ